MHVEFSAEAEADLRTIGGRIAETSPKRAARFVQELVYACGTLADMSLAFPLYPDRESSGIRKKVYKRYLIFYRAEEQRVTIVHIIHGKRDHAALLFDDE